MIDKSERYEFILNSLMKASSDDADLNGIEEVAKKMSQLSSRHHYLPRYYIDGFCGPDGMVSVYDKENDIIHSVRKPPKSIFFEIDRHTIEVNGLKLSMLEDHFFSDTDSRLAPYVTRLRDKPNNEDLLTTEIAAHMSVFVIDLFWRNPKTDYAALDLFERSRMTWVDELTGKSFQDAEREKRYKADPVNRKMERFKMHIQSMLQIGEEKRSGHSYSKLWEFKSSPFILGDYPIIFRKTPQTHTDLVRLGHFLPISSNRIYADIEAEGLNFQLSDTCIVNAIQIDQAKKFVVASNLKVLEESIRFYRAVKKDRKLQWFKEALFKNLIFE